MIETALSRTLSSQAFPSSIVMLLYQSQSFRVLKEYAQPLASKRYIQTRLACVGDAITAGISLFWIHFTCRRAYCRVPRFIWATPSSNNEAAGDDRSDIRRAVKSPPGWGGCELKYEENSL